MAEPKRDEPPTLTAEEARQGQIVLNTRRRRAIFFAGLIAALVVAALVMALWP